MRLPDEIERHWIPTALAWIEIEYGFRGLRRLELQDHPPVAWPAEEGCDPPEAPAAAWRDRPIESIWATHFDEIRHRAEGGAARRALPVDREARAALAGPPDSIRARTWQLLETIPRGEAWSYGELARRLDRPRAVRAVARACATNPLLIVVPCHRVVCSDGSPGGYRGGLARKAALLRSEGAL